MAAMRTKPVRRESAVPTATTALDRTSDVSASVGLEPGSMRPGSSSTSSLGRRRSFVRSRRVARRACAIRERAGACCLRPPLASPVDVPAPPEREEHDRAHGQEDSHTAHEGRADRDRVVPPIGRPSVVGDRHAAPATCPSRGSRPPPAPSCCAGAREDHVALGAVGEEEAVALELHVDGRRSWSLVFWKLIGISALLDVMVIVPGGCTWIWSRKPSTEVPIDVEQVARAACGRPGSAQSADTDGASARSAR